MRLIIIFTIHSYYKRSSLTKPVPFGLEPISLGFSSDFERPKTEQKRPVLNVRKPNVRKREAKTFGFRQYSDFGRSDFSHPLYLFIIDLQYIMLLFGG